MSNSYLFSLKKYELDEEREGKGKGRRGLNTLLHLCRAAQSGY